MFRKSETPMPIFAFGWCFYNQQDKLIRIESPVYRQPYRVPEKWQIGYNGPARIRKNVLLPGQVAILPSADRR